MPLYISTQNQKILALALLFLCICYGGYLRVAELSQEQFWIDEAFHLFQADGIHHHGTPTLRSGILDIKDAFCAYTIAALSYLPSDNETTFRLLSVAAGTATIALAYILTRILGASHWAALIPAAFVTFSSAHIAWSRQIKPYAPLVLEMLTFFVFLSLFAQKKQPIYAVIAFAFLVLAMFTKTIGAVLILPFCVVLLTAMPKQSRWVIILLSTVFLIPFTFWALSHFQFFSLHNYLYFYLIQYHLFTYSFFFLCFLVFASWCIMYRQYKTFLITLVLTWIAALLFLSFFVYVNQFRYMFPFLFILPVGIALFLTRRPPLLGLSKKTIGLILIVLMSTGILWDTTKTRGAFQWTPCTSHCILEHYTPQPDFRVAFQYLQETFPDQKDALLITPYPYMALLYGWFDVRALSISYTGKEDDISIAPGRREYYSGIAEVDSIGEILTLAQDRQLLLLVDPMGRDRIDNKIFNFFRYYGKEERVLTSPRRDTLWLYSLGPLDPNNTSEDSVFPSPTLTNSADFEAIEVEVNSLRERLDSTQLNYEIDVEISDEDFEDDEVLWIGPNTERE